MKTRHPLTVLFYAGMLIAWPFSQAADAPRDTSDYPADPRIVVSEFYLHIREGDAEAARKCWDSSVRKDADPGREETQIRNTIAQWIAQFRLEGALEKKLPELYAKMKTDGQLTPTPEQLSKASFTTIRRLAIVRWNSDEDAALPLELDTGMKPPRWFISASHYRETTRASVGDSFRATDLMATVANEVIKDVLDGRVRTEVDLQAAQMRHMAEQMEKMK